MSSEEDASCQKLIVGSEADFWLWDGSQWDLSRTDSTEGVSVDRELVLSCDITRVKIDTAKTALIIIDLQNYSLSSALGVEWTSDMSKLRENLLNLAIPASRKRGIQIIWLNWGLTEKDLIELPPSIVRLFGWDAHCNDNELSLLCQDSLASIPHGEGHARPYPGIDMGQIVSEQGAVIGAGRALMRGFWNTGIHCTFEAAYETGLHASKPDVLLHKNRTSGLWDSSTDSSKFLKDKGIRGLLFAGVNTDQCVLSTMQDAQARGFDVIMLKDGCATSNPEFTRHCVEFNCNAAMGFVSSCRALALAADLYPDTSNK